MALNVSSLSQTNVLTDSEITAGSDVMSQVDYIIIEGVISGISASLAFVGIAGNVFTIVTFFSMGIQDGVSVTFLYMAITDLAYLVTVIAMAVTFLLMTVEVNSRYAVWFPVEPYGVYGFFALSGRYPYEASNLCTACLSIVRCLCVARPLLFRNIFGKKVALFIITSFSVFSIVCFTPVLYYMGMTIQYNKYINASRPSIFISPTRDKVKDIIWTLTDAFIPITTQVIIVFCVIVMVQSLRSASEFRQKCSSGSASEFRQKCSSGSASEFRQKCLSGSASEFRQKCSSGSGKHHKDSLWKHHLALNVKPQRNESSSNSLGGKELQVVQQVVLICTVFIVCNTPIIVINFVGMYNKEFALQKTYHNLFLSMIGLKHFFQTINSSFNVFIYFKYNTKFRQTLVQIFCYK